MQMRTLSNISGSPERILFKFRLICISINVNTKLFACLNYRAGVMVFNATFNNISVILWRSVLLVEETGIPGENHRPATSLRQTLSHNVVLSTPLHERDSNSQL
jgi:hypothetical protein